MSTYPYTDEDGRTMWACCVSSIGRPCAHERVAAAQLAEQDARTKVLTEDEHYPDSVPAEHEHGDVTHEHAYGMADHTHEVLTGDEHADAVIGYLECAGWLVAWHEGHPEDDETGYEGDHRHGPFSEHADAHAAAAVAEFVDAAGAEDVRAYLDAYASECPHDGRCTYGCGATPAGERLGHDLWLTRNRHGAGFWDRGLGELGDRLSDAARAMGEANSYVLDDEDETVEVEA